MSSFNQQECLGCGQLCDGLYCYPCTCQQCGVGLTNGIYLNCTYRDGKSLICCKCEGPLRGGFCWFCASNSEIPFNNDPNPSSFDDSQNLSDYSPQPQYKTYPCELYGNDSHYGYDCPPRFPLVYEQKPCYNQNFNENCYPHNSLKQELREQEQAAQEKEEPSQNSDIRQLIREVCGIKVCEKQKQNMEDTMLELLEEFSGELMPTIIINEERIKREHEEYISLMEKLLTINSFPRLLENFHANTIIETLLTSPIPVEDSDSLREEIDIFTGTDDFMPPGIESDDYDSEGDIHFLEELLGNDSLPLPKDELSNFDHHDDPSFPRPPLEPPDVEVFFDFEPNSGEWISAVMSNIDELNKDECFDRGGGGIYVFENIKDDDYIPFIFVIRIFLPYLTYPEVSPLLLSTRSDDTIFDPGIST
nr:hypothetical protein [Tanacetum cinerariifolium]